MKPLPKFDPNASSESQKKEGKMDLRQTETQSSPAIVDAAITEQPAARPDRKPRTRIQHERSQFVHATNTYRRALGAEFDAPDLLRLTDVNEVSQDEFAAIRDRVAAALVLGVEGIGKSKVPSLDVELENFELWQHQRVSYFHWDEAALEALRRKLEQLGPGCELIPCFAMSVQVKLPSGKLILINRRGEQTKS